MLSTFLIAFSTLFAIVDPIACLGPFLAMTDGWSTDRRRQIALKAVLIATAIMVTCAIGGNSIFKFYGITLPALKLAGGLLLFALSFEMLYAHPSRVRQTEEEQEEGSSRQDIAIFPLAVPLLAGPGAIASVIILVDRAENWIGTATVYLAVLATMLVSLIIFYFAQTLSRYLGTIGMNIFTRLMGLILAAISMQFVLDALHDAFPALLGPGA